MTPLLLTLLVAGQVPTGGDCKSAYGMTACGFDCTAAYGVVRCAQTPQGACHAAYGLVLCFDPPSWRVQQKATCLAASGAIACGYACRAAYGEVRCAELPGGECRAEAGRLVCLSPVATADPDRRLRSARAEVAGPAVAPRCLSAYGLTACGFGCQAAYGQVACAQTPRGLCRAAYGQVTCWDPPAFDRLRGRRR